MVALQDCLDTLTEVICSQQEEGGRHEPTPSEYFALILVTLSSRVEEDKLPLFLQILDGVIPNTSTSLLQSQYRSFAKVILHIMSLTNSPTARHYALECIGKVLLVQETSDGFWNQVTALQGINTLLGGIDDENQKIRKASMTCLHNLLAAHNTKRYATIRAYIAEFAIGIMKACTRANYRRALCVLLFLESTLFSMPADWIKKLVSASLRLQTIEMPKVTASIYRMCDALFQHPNYAFSSATTQSLLSNLLTHAPLLGDVEANCYYCCALASALSILIKLDHVAAYAMVSGVVDGLGKHMDTEFEQVHIAACMSMKRIFQQLLASVSPLILPTNLAQSLFPHPTTALTAVSKSKLDARLGVVFDVIDATEKLLRLRGRPPSVYMLEVVKGVLVGVRGLGGALGPGNLVGNVVVRLGELVTERGDAAGDLTPVLDTLTVAIHTVPLSLFLTFLPLVDPVVTRGELVKVLEGRGWVVELLRCALRSSHTTLLSDFMVSLLPYASRFHKLASDAQLGLSEVGQKVVRARVSGVWSLLPEICVNPNSDLLTSFPEMRSVLKGALEEQEYEDIPHYVVLALGRIGGHLTSGTSTVQICEAEAAFYLPLLLTHLEQLTLGKGGDDVGGYGGGKYKECIQTISVWMKAAHTTLCQQITTKLLKGVLKSTMGQHGGEGGSQAAVYMSLLLATIPVLSKNRDLVGLVYKTIHPLFSLDTHVSVQKNAFMLLNALITYHIQTLYSHTSALELVEMLKNSIQHSHISATYRGLQCVSSLAKWLDSNGMAASMDKLLEGVLSCQHGNMKCRQMGREVLKVWGERGVKKAQLPEDTSDGMTVAVDEASSEGWGEGGGYLGQKLTDIIMRGMEGSGLDKNAGGMGVAMDGRAKANVQLVVFAMHAFSELLKAQHKKWGGRVGKSGAGEEMDVCGDGKRKRGRGEYEDEEGGEDAEDEDEEDDDEEEESEHGEDQGDEDAAEVDEVNEDGNASNPFHIDDDQTGREGYLHLLTLSLQLLPLLSPLLALSHAPVTKASLTLLKALAICLPASQIRQNGQRMVTMATVEVGAFKSKMSILIRGVLRKLTKRLGGEALRGMVGQADMPLMDYIEREGRKDVRKRLGRKGLKPKAEGESDSEDDGNKMDRDNGDTRDERLGGRKVKGVRMGEGRKGGNLLTALLDELMHGKKSATRGVGMGAIEEEEEGATGKGEEKYEVKVEGGKVIVKEKIEPVDIAGSAKKDHNTDSKPSSADGYVHKKPRRAPPAPLPELGVEYRSKKAGGDVWVGKGGVAPHAYLPLDPRLLSKKHRGAVVKQFESVGNSGKRNKMMGARNRKEKGKGGK